MSRIYARDPETGKNVLLRLVCSICDASIKPSPDIAHSGWVTYGEYYGPGDDRNWESEYCPEHARI